MNAAKTKSALPAPGEGATIVEQACSRLRRIVVQGRIVGGQPLIETELAASLAVSRSTVREVLRRLQSEGLLVARARGLQVRRLTRRDVADLYELRAQLEAWAARRAAEQGALGAERLTRERRLWADAGFTFGIAAFGAQNRRLHDDIAAAAGNAHLPRLLDQTLMSLFAAQFRMWLSPAAMTSAARDHVEIVDALAARDARTAERVMRRHIQQSARAILALPDDAFA